MVSTIYSSEQVIFMTFRNKSLTESAIMDEVRNVTGPRGVRKILRQVKNFGPSTIRDVTSELEARVNGKLFPVKKRLKAIGKIRKARLDGTRVKPMPR
jgi:hypothetical protein